MAGKPLTTEIPLCQSPLLYHGAHGSVEHQQSFSSNFPQGTVGLRHTVGLCHLTLHTLHDGLYLKVGLILAGSHTNHLLHGLYPALVHIGLIFLHDAQCLLHLVLVVEIHFQVHTVRTDVVEQWPQFVQRHPARHDTLACRQNPAVQVIPFG